MFVLQMHGAPGSGKSTLARAIGARTGALALDKDVIKAALLDSGIDERAAAAGAYEAYFALAESIVAQGVSLVLDNPVYWPRVEAGWHAISRAAGVPPLLIECVCPDRDELRRRLATREARSSQPREPIDASALSGTIAVGGARLTLDTTRPLADLVADALAYIRAAVAAP